jgi:hypothetical protein
VYGILPFEYPNDIVDRLRDLAVLGLCGLSGNMGRRDHPGHGQQRVRQEERLLAEDIQARPTELPFGEDPG